MVFALLHGGANQDQTEHLTAETQSKLKIEMDRTYQDILSRMKTSDQALLEESQANWSENLSKYQQTLPDDQVNTVRAIEIQLRIKALKQADLNKEFFDIDERTFNSNPQVPVYIGMRYTLSDAAWAEPANELARSYLALLQSDINQEEDFAWIREKLGLSLDQIRAIVVRNDASNRPEVCLMSSSQNSPSSEDKIGISCQPVNIQK